MDNHFQLCSSHLLPVTCKASNIFSFCSSLALIFAEPKKGTNFFAILAVSIRQKGRKEEEEEDMDRPNATCPADAFRYNGSLCACDPGRYLPANATRCVLFDTGGEWVVGSGVSPSPTFLTTVLPLDSIRRFTQSQALLLEVTLLVLLLWLLACLALRLVKLDPAGRSVWFRFRWWISRFDIFFDTNHWLEDNKVVIKRKTELGGAFSLATLILFVGLFSALLYQIITKGSIEVHRVKPANAPDLLSFVNDLEFNITTISSMSCSHLRAPNTLVIGTPGFIDYRVFPLSTYIDYRCQNTSIGPTISLKCKKCQIPRRNLYVSWQFVDLPNNPATAVGFQFNLSAKDHADDRHVSFVSGTMKSDSYTNDKPKTLRGSDSNILTIQLFPQVYKYLQNLKLIQPLFHDFVPGTSFSEVSDLQASLQNSRDGLINTTLYISYVSDYIVEVSKENMISPVGFLADLGGLYAISIAVFLYFLIQCEGRIKKLRNEDSIMRNIISQRRAQKNWDKLRKFVLYTWGPSNLDVGSNDPKRLSLMIDSIHGGGAWQKKKRPSKNTILYSEKMKEPFPHSEVNHGNLEIQEVRD